jgi:hypothetical protein
MTRLEKEQFIALMACPVDWENETGLVDWDFGPLEYNWEYILRQHAINESDISYNRVAETLLDENDKELGYLVKNVNLRRAVAVKDYARQAGRLSGLRFVTASERGKHFLYGADRAAVVRNTASSRSLFFKNYGASELKALPEALQFGLGHTGADAARVNEVALWSVVPEQQRPDPMSTAFRVTPADHDKFFPIEL